MNEYANYSFSHLYDHGRLLNKAITDNWQYRILYNRIKQGVLCKAKLSEGYKLYTVTALVFENYNTKPEYEYIQDFPAKNPTEAERKMIRVRFYHELLSTGIEHEYVFPDESGIVKMKVVEKGD